MHATPICKRRDLITHNNNACVFESCNYIQTDTTAKLCTQPLLTDLVVPLVIECWHYVVEMTWHFLFVLSSETYYLVRYKHLSHFTIFQIPFVDYIVYQEWGTMTTSNLLRTNLRKYFYHWVLSSDPLTLEWVWYSRLHCQNNYIHRTKYI